MVSFFENTVVYSFYFLPITGHMVWLMILMLKLWRASEFKKKIDPTVHSESKKFLGFGEAFNIGWTCVIQHILMNKRTVILEKIS